MARKKIDVEIMKLGPDHIMRCLDQLYDLAVEGSPILKSAKNIGNHYAAGTGSLEERARRLVQWQVTKAGTAGFLTGLGGVITMPVAIPANIAGAISRKATYAFSSASERLKASTTSRFAGRRAAYKRYARPQSFDTSP